MSEAAFGRKIEALDDLKRRKEVEKFVDSISKFMDLLSELMGSIPIWKYFSTKKWNEFSATADEFYKLII